MEPAFQRGDLLFLENRKPQGHLGSIIVYEVEDKTIPIVHRIVRKYGTG